MSIILACGARPLSSINCNATRSIIDNNQQYPVLITHVFAATWNGLNSEQMCESRPDCMVNKTWREFTRHTVSIVFECNSYVNTHSTVSLDVNGIVFGVVYNESSKSMHVWDMRDGWMVCLITTRHKCTKTYRQYSIRVQFMHHLSWFTLRSYSGEYLIPLKGKTAQYSQSRTCLRHYWRWRHFRYKRQTNPIVRLIQVRLYRAITYLSSFVIKNHP